MKKYIKFELLLDDPQYVIKRIFQRILIVNRNTSQRKKGIVNNATQYHKFRMKRLRVQLRLF